MPSTLKRLAAGENSGDETSTAVVEYKEQPSSRKLREYRGSNLSSGSRRAIESQGCRKSDNVTDADYEVISDAEYAKSVKESMKSAYGNIPSTKSFNKRPSTNLTTMNYGAQAIHSKRSYKPEELGNH